MGQHTDRAVTNPEKYMTDTNHTDSVEVKIWSAFNDRKPFKLEEAIEELKSTLQATHSQQVEEAVRKRDEDIQRLRYFVARLYCAAGCDCCRDTEIWNEAASVLAVMLGIPAYEDGSGFDFYKVRDEGKALTPNHQD